jgi:hypothetical protein
MIGLNVRRTHALIIKSLPLPPNVEGPKLSPMIMVDGIGVSVISQPLVMEK